MFYVGKEGAWKELLVTIVEANGGSYVIATPHGTKIKLGLVYLNRDWSEFTPAQQAQFLEYKKSAAWQNSNDKNGDA